MRVWQTLSSAALVLIVAGSSVSRAAADPSIAPFMVLKKEVEDLRQDPERKKFRHNYEKLVVKLQGVANTQKEGTRADDCAFVAAQLLEELASVSVVSADRAAAVDAFASMAERFPKSNLKDDALIAAARLTDEVVRGRAFVDAVLAMPVADLKSEASLLKKGRFNDAAVKEAKKKTAVAVASFAAAAPAVMTVKSALQKIQPESITPAQAQPAPAAPAPGVNAGPCLPPLRKASRESIDSPPWAWEPVWQPPHCCFSRGRRGSWPQARVEKTTTIQSRMLAAVYQIATPIWD